MLALCQIPSLPKELETFKRSALFLSAVMLLDA